MQTKLKILVIAFGVIIVVLLGVLLFVSPVQGPTLPLNATSSPPTASGPKVTLPGTNDIITSPVSVVGTVTGGGWFFEASFPVKVLDGDGTILGQSPAQAGSEWMTTGTVPFAAHITFKAPKYATGTILLEKDNPSGLPQNAGEFRVPVRFK
jgi:hypothetical protein